ncbi:glycyl-radical enzyme activating protein [Desulfomonile tiedjei]|uniref:Glycyl-radical enzyme activator family protein n=1 Tax=Desulfomonile tiedjei (strain ATCC 49306 / DSM 6799 / DCB-1) TaxID=706587 RepID=I4C5J7_DESTA|nr:glycyl-radical enzyme activating protein [Desulfomonile tiedjei]AFM24838.1 glycyl-radical enzyme activator family protein [Desulfomonile tiedjei DSM 6799]
MEPLRGLIFGIERFALHDGPGIRTLVFMKGCPLRCLWCSSPQTQEPHAQITYDYSACRKCGACAASCPTQALTFSPDSGVRADFTLCDRCDKCLTVCPGNALQLMGRWLSTEDLFREVTRDSAFFRRSKGGITVGGGEPTFQPRFVSEFMRRCKDSNIHTAMETCGYCPWESLDNILEHTDTVFMDIKHMDDRVHRRLTGVSNRSIRENARKVAQKRPLIVRIPVVPGLNDSEENVRATAKFAAQLGKNLLRIELLPYHKLGLGNYERLGKNYQLTEVEPPSDERMELLRSATEGCGIQVRVAGRGL